MSSIYENRALRKLALGLSIACTAIFMTPNSWSTSWEPIGPRGASVVALTSNPQDLTHLYACTFSGGVYESTNSGLTWSHIAAPFSNQYTFDLLVNPLVTTTLFVATFEDGIYKSQNSGGTWAPINVGLTDLTVLDLESTTTSGTIFAATRAGVFYSRNSGSSWTLGNDDVDDMYATGLFIDPLAPSTVYAQTAGQGIFRSVDDGTTWTQLTNGLTAEGINDLELDVRDQAWVYAAAGTGVYRISYANFAADSGSWENIGYALNDKSVFQILTLPNTGILAALSEGVFEFDGVNTWDLWADIPSRLLMAKPDGSVIHVAGELDVLSVTIDQGETFYPANAGIQNRFVGTLDTIDVAGWTTIYAGTEKGVELTSEVFRSGDRLPWILGHIFNGAIFDLGHEASDPSTLYIGTERNGVWKASEYGMSWTSSSNGMVPNRINAIDQSRTGSQRLYAGTSSGLYTSLDQGATWSNQGNNDTPKDVTAIATHSESDLIAYYGTRSGQVFLTFSGGESFLAAWPGNGNAIRNIIIAPYRNDYLTLENGDLYASYDGAFQFFPIEDMAAQKVVDVVVDAAQPWIAFAATTTGGVYRTEDTGFNWTAVNTGISDLGIISIDIAYADADLLYAGAEGTVYKSTDGAQTWTSQSNGLPAGKVARLQISDDDNSVVYAVVNESAVYRTTDGGANWALFYDDPANGKELPFLEDQAFGDVFYRGTLGGGIQKTTNAGTNWAASNEGIRLFIRTLEVSWDDLGTVYAGSLNDGLFKTTNGGASWSPSGLEDRNLFKIAMDPLDKNVLFAGSSLGVSKSSDAGLTWTDLWQLNEYFFDLYVAPADPNLIYGTGLGGNVVVSTNHGTSWTRLGADVPKVNVLAFARDSINDILYCAPEFEGVYKSDDGGATWTSTGLDLEGLQVLTLHVAGNGDLFAGTQADGLFTSSDEGETFTQVSVALDSNYVADLRALPGQPNTIIVQTLSGTPGDKPLYRSTDNGSSWSVVSTGINDSSIISIASSPDRTVLYASSSDSLFKSTDDMVSWQWVSDFPAGTEGRSVDILPTDSNTVFVGTLASGVLKSTNGGSTWTTAPSTGGLSVNHVIVGSDETIWAGTLGMGLIESSNDGSTWTDTADTGLLNSPVLDIAIDPSNTNNVYAATGGSGVHKSIDGGFTWSPMNNGVTGLNLLAMTIDANNPQTLYAGSSTEGVFRTVNGGSSWTTMNEGLSNLTVTALEVDVNDSNIVYVGTEGGGAFRWKP